MTANKDVLSFEVRVLNTLVLAITVVCEYAYIIQILLHDSKINPLK